MRAVHLICAAVVAALSLAAKVQADAQEVFRVGITAPTVNMLPLWMARDAGLFRMVVPQSLGGSELSLIELSRVCEAVAMGDASTGWRQADHL